jgi:hypothetical protein
MIGYIKRASVFILLLSISFLFLNCRNPLTQIGLGDKIDLEAPDLSVGSHDNGSYVRGSVILSGTFADDYTGVTVKISFDDGLTFSSVTDVNEDTGTWNYTLDTTLYPDGPKDVVIDITDSAGRVITNRLLLYFDNTPPLVLVNVPLGYDPASFEYNGNVAIKGDATDQFPIDRVEMEVRSGASVILSGTANGTNSWSFIFESETYVHGIGEYDFVLTAYDRAGNGSSYLYHAQDVMDINGGLPLSVEDLYIIDNGGIVSGLDEDNLEGIAKTELTLRINQGLDLPQFEVYNPDPAAVYPDNQLSAASKAIGMVTDDEEGIDISSIKIQFDGDPNPWIPVDTTIGSGLAVRWEHPLISLAPGPHTLRLQAEDIYGALGFSNPVDFEIDAGVPVIEIDSPALGAYLNTTSYTISGNTFGSAGTVDAVDVSLNGGPYNAATSTSGSYDTWEYDVGPPDPSPEGVVAVKARATDSGKVAYYNLQVIVDIDPPIVAFLSPTKSTSVNGPVTVRGASSDNRQITKVELRIGEPLNWINLPDLYNWEYLFDSAGYANTTYATETPADSNIWKLNIYARITDIAGNVKTTTAADYFIYIDQELDKPSVNIISPPAGTTNVGGPLLISGTALDDDGLDRVEMQINVNGDGIHAGDDNFADQVEFWNGVSNSKDDPADFDDYFEDESAWYTVSGTSLWSQEINNYGEMYNIPGGDGYIIVRVRAVDINGIEGDIKEFYIHLDDLIPRIESLNISSGDYVKGIFNITGKALDDEEIDKLLISYDGGINYGDLPEIYYTKNLPLPYKDYDLNIQINTTDTGPPTPALDIDSGILYLRFKITDTSNYQSITSLNLNVDNLYPSNAPSGYTADAMDINGTAARVQGTAQDGGTVSGIDRIEVYFVDGGNVFNPTTGATTAVGSYDFGDGSGTVDYPTGAGSDNYKIVIDDTNEFGNDGGGNGDGDGFDESLTLAGSTYNWWAEFDSNVIPDGTLKIHYVIFDNAGNGTHYELDGFVKNHKPVINAVIVGSDVDNNGSVEVGGPDDETFTYTGPFTARSRLYIEIDATDNDTLLSSNFEVFHGALEFNDSSGTIDITQLPEYSDGATTFLCRVTDPDGITAQTTINVTIENTDLVPPVITIDPLSQSDVVDGHLEDINSLHDGLDPDVSGTVNLTGTASDNQRIQSITVTIDDFDAGSGTGAEHTVASWSGGTLVAVPASNFTIDTQTLTEAGGHQISWTYIWNSADITGAAKDNLNIQFRAQDFNPNSDTDSTGVDAVPYISDITRTSPMQRSKYGNFQVQQGESNVTIHGYNLDDSGTHWIRVHNTSGGDPDAGAWNAVTMPATGSPYTSMTVNLTGVTHSGWLRLMVNGVEAINNGNDNSLTANKEDDGNGLGSTKWTDDRYLRVWQVGDTIQSSDDAQYPSMSIMGDGTLYGAWINYATSLLTYGTTSTGPFTQWGIYDPPEYTDMNVDPSEATLKYAIAFVANHYGGSGWGNVPLDVGTAGFVGVRTPNSRRVDAGYANAVAYPIESLNLNQQLWQFGRPKVVRSDGGASDAQDRIHVAYYDSKTKAAKYSFMLDDGQATVRGWIVLDGGTDADDVRYVTGVGTRPGGTTLTDAALAGNPMIANDQTIMLMDTNGNSSWTTISSGAGTGTLTLANFTNTARSHYTIVTGTSNLVTTGVARSTNAGEYVAIDVDENGLPVVIYYNTAAQTLRLARANKINPTAPADWTRQNVFAGGDPNAMFSGQHVAMKFDVNGNLHVVCYRSSAGDLLYLYAPDADGTDYVFQNSVVVDSEGAVGTSPDITLNGTTPYISYLNNSMIGTFEGLKMAYYDGGLGDWEYEIVPVSTAVNDSRTSLEYRKGAVPWLIAMGYSSSSFDIVYLKPEE